MRVLAEKRKSAEHLAFGPGTRLAVAYSSGLVVWDVATGEPVNRLVYQDYAPMLGGNVPVLLPPDGRAVYLASVHEGLVGIRLADRSREPIDQPGDRSLFGAAMSPDGRRVVCHFWWHRRWQGTRDSRSLVAYRRKGDRPPEFDSFTTPEDSQIDALAFFPDGTRFATAELGYRPVDPAGSFLSAQEPLVRVRKWPGERGVASAVCPKGSVDSVAVSPDGAVVAGRAGANLLVWPASLNGEPVLARNDNRKHFTGFAFHPSGKYLAATSNDTTVKVFEAETLAVARTYTWGVGKLKSVAFSADGSLAAAAGEGGQVIVWDVDL